MNKNMRFCILIVSILTASEASSYHSNHRGYNRFPLAFSSSLPSEITQSARDELFTYSQQINKESKTGVLISDKDIKQKLNKLTAELEAVCDNPSAKSQELMVGDWKLLCSVATTSQEMAPKKKFFGLPFPPKNLLQNVNEFINPIQNSIRDSVQVVQRIRSISDNDDFPTMVEGIDTFNRVDNVIEFTPSPLTTFLEQNQPDAIMNLNFNFNPLEVSKSKVTLAHTAKVQSISPLLRTKIALKSVILTVAGTSQYLEPNGEDVLGLNVPLGDLLNFGSFDTTYVDEEMRVSRGKVGLIDQLRVFVRITEDTVDMEESVVEETDEIVAEEEETTIDLEETDEIDDSKEHETENEEIESMDEIAEEETETVVEEEEDNEEINNAEIVSEEDDEAEEKDERSEDDK